MSMQKPCRRLDAGNRHWRIGEEKERKRMFIYGRKVKTQMHTQGIFAAARNTLKDVNYFWSGLALFFA